MDYLVGLRINLVDAEVAARKLLGWELRYDSSEGLVGGYIVETEAYRADDAASHAFGGLGRRNASMYEAAGTIYIYFTYGMHFCMNIVTGAVGDGQGVLLRALQPTVGIPVMQQRRPHAKSEYDLTNGPAKLAQALGINKSLNGTRLGDKLQLEPGFKPKLIMQSPRIGITKNIDKPWRFFVAGNPYVSANRNHAIL